MKEHHVKRAPTDTTVIMGRHVSAVLMASTRK
eukprot:COSAG02_NODE_29788_length_563_cov_0.644397_1_plen_31_part_10